MRFADGLASTILGLSFDKLLWRGMRSHSASWPMYARRTSASKSERVTM